jgi:ribosome maturation factor RimP
VQRAGGVDVDEVASLTRAVSRALDEADPIDSRYTLEVSTPGLERTLRTPQHFAGAVGETARIRLRPEVEGDRRVEGVVTGADDDGVTVRVDDETERHLRYDEIDRARTVFVWGPPAKEKRKP